MTYEVTIHKCLKCRVPTKLVSSNKKGTLLTVVTKCAQCKDKYKYKSTFSTK